jgi:2,4-diketo-3-deoxy-L-fuconate hydrolase
VHDLHPGDLIATGMPAGCPLSIPSPMMQRIGALLPKKTKWDIFMGVQGKRAQRVLRLCGRQDGTFADNRAGA